jgi:hypothetical protein
MCKLSQFSKFIKCLRRDKLSPFSNAPEVQFVRTPDSEGDKDAWETVSNTTSYVARSVMALQTLRHRPHFVATWSMCVTCSYCSAAAHLCLSCFLQFVQFSHNVGRTSTILSQKSSKFYETFLGYQNKIIIISASSQIMSSHKYKNNKNSRLSPTVFTNHLLNLCYSNNEVCNVHSRYSLNLAL